MCIVSDKINIAINDLIIFPSILAPWSLHIPLGLWHFLTPTGLILDKINIFLNDLMMYSSTSSFLSIVHVSFRTILELKLTSIKPSSEIELLNHSVIDLPSCISSYLSN